MAPPPKYANQEKVNPGSVVLSGEMMLRYLGWNEAADRVIRGLRAPLRPAGSLTLSPASWTAPPKSSVPNSPITSSLTCSSRWAAARGPTRARPAPPAPAGLRRPAFPQPRRLRFL
jgi:hypothetical protein